ncbi:MAG: Asp-tRNA(Asn)/Glu-tRNA(Gln) amidotransferase subunit GatC [Cyanobacteriota bacterium]|nr:Asp-tRNA(Asn)/Glu-tRNA(Gln) amidotransferase subunit GatC [Cyanobacteriota bacterium]
MGRISPEDVRKVAELARLELPDDKIATYTTQLERILDYVAHLQQVDTEGVPETTRAVEVPNVTRADHVEITDIREDLLELAPHREGDFYRVPRILGEQA